MARGRVLYAGLALLDRQLVDRAGRRCGKVDDLELAETGEGGPLIVSAVLSGPGALLSRTGRTHAGGWLRTFVDRSSATGRDDPVRIPIRNVADIGNHVTVSLPAHELATDAAERWVRDHVIARLPGSRDASPG